MNAAFCTKPSTRHRKIGRAWSLHERSVLIPIRLQIPLSWRRISMASDRARSFTEFLIHQALTSPPIPETTSWYARKTFRMVQWSPEGCFNLSSVSTGLESSFETPRNNLDEAEITETISMTSLEHSSSSEASIVRENFGSTGNIAIFLPTSVRFWCLSTAPRIDKVVSPECTEPCQRLCITGRWISIDWPASPSGWSIKSTSSMSRSRHFNSRMIAVKLHLRISGSNTGAIESKACFGNSRKQNPSPCHRRQNFHLLKRRSQTPRPARPARCIAEDLLMSRVNNVSTPTKVVLVEIIYNH